MNPNEKDYGAPGFVLGDAIRFLQYNIDLDKMRVGVRTIPNGIHIANDRSGFAGSFNPYHSRIEGSVQIMESAAGLQLVLTFEGSMDVSDWLIDGMTSAIDGIHSGFRMSYERFVTENIDSDELKVPIRGLNTLPDGSYSLRELLNIVRGVPGARLYITGHSYGAALAQCMTYYMICKFGMPAGKIATYTFASPVPFTYEFVEAHPELQKASVYNVINIDDIVPVVGVSRESTGRRASNLRHTITENGMNMLRLREGGYNESGCNIGYNLYYDTGSERYTAIGEHHMEKSYMKMLTTSEPVRVKTCTELLDAWHNREKRTHRVHLRKVPIIRTEKLRRFAPKLKLPKRKKN